MGVYAPTGEYRDFQSTRHDGDIGEDLMKKYIEKQGFVVIDRSDDPVYRAKDIDFEFGKPNGKFHSVEVKTDGRMWETGNIVVEVCMHRKSGRVDGWLYYCEADYLCFIDIKNLRYYFFDWKKLRKKVFQGCWKIVNFGNGTDNCRGEVCKIPLKDLRNLGLIVIEGQLYFGQL